MEHKILKIFNSGKIVYNGFQKIVTQKRFFLSEAYQCEEAWKNRLQSPLLQKFKPNELFVILDNKFHIDKKINAVDMDIFANSLDKENQVEELLNLLQKFRRSAETSNILDSTHHAVIRYLLDNNYTEELMDVLHNRLNYGIFPDYVTYNILMDTYIKNQDYANAAKVAILPMLQEESEHLITNALSIYACHKYLENPNKWQKPPEPVEDTKEEIKIRVPYLRNPFFDDHFDLTDPYDLVGKTLAFQGQFMNNELGRTCQLRGLILYKKYQDALKLIKQWINEIKGNIVYKEVFDLIEKDNKNIFQKQDEFPITDEFKILMSELNLIKEKNLCTDNLINVLENNIKSAIEKQHDIDINEQMQKYVEWEKQRQLALDKQIEEINRTAKKEEIEKLKEEMKKQERFLTFFENEEDIELKIEKIKEREKKNMERVLKMPYAKKKLKKLEEEKEYTPPMI